MRSNTFSLLETNFYGTFGSSNIVCLDARLECPARPGMNANSTKKVARMHNLEFTLKLTIICFKISKSKPVHLSYSNINIFYIAVIPQLVASKDYAPIMFCLNRWM